MARAGFYAIQASKLRFGRDGRWYADGEAILNERIAKLFSQHLKAREDGTYAIELGEESALVEVEDTPWVVTCVTLGANGTLTVELNDGSTEQLDPANLRIGEQNVMYCSVKGGRGRARLLRPAYYQLAQYIAEVEPGRFALRVKGREHRLEGS